MGKEGKGDGITEVYGTEREVRTNRSTADKYWLRPGRELRNALPAMSRPDGRFHEKNRARC
jgi:hypothetical protein